MEVISVLMVEDNPDDAILISEFLVKVTMYQFKIDVVTTLADAIKTMKEDLFDVVLLDLNLPDSFGIKTVRQLVSHFPYVAIIVLTSIKDDYLAIQTVKYGAQDYLEKKDISSTWLGRAIRYAIERKQISRQKDELLIGLSAALAEIEKLQSIIPICTSCKKIRNDSGHWQNIDEYLKKRIGTDSNHWICPKCLENFLSNSNSQKE